MSIGNAARIERSSESRRRLSQYALIAGGIVLVAGAANIAAVVVVPIVASLFLCVLLWPLRRWLSRWMPSWVAAMACSAVLIGVMLVVIGWASYASVSAAEQFRASQGDPRSRR
jgi:predicted PurR-regulated permease PerM